MLKERRKWGNCPLETKDDFLDQDILFISIVKVWPHGDLLYFSEGHMATLIHRKFGDQELQQSGTLHLSFPYKHNSIIFVSYRKMMSWKKDTNCCLWDGVTCNKATGNVISLDLSCSWLRGNIPSNTSLFHLLHLQTLDLSDNDFEYSRFLLVLAVSEI